MWANRTLEHLALQGLRRVLLPVFSPLPPTQLNQEINKMLCFVSFHNWKIKGFPLEFLPPQEGHPVISPWEKLSVILCFRHYILTQLDVLPGKKSVWYEKLPMLWSCEPEIELECRRSGFNFCLPLNMFLWVTGWPQSSRPVAWKHCGYYEKCQDLFAQRAVSLLLVMKILFCSLLPSTPSPRSIHSLSLLLSQQHFEAV